MQKVRDIESNKEKQFLMEQSQVAATMQAKTEAKISALSCEVMALKECYDTARMACQVSITHNLQWVIVFSNVRINSFCIHFICCATFGNWSVEIQICLELHGLYTNLLAFHT